MPLTVSELYQRHLDGVSRAMRENDLDAMLRHVALPHQIVAEDAEIVVTSADALFLLMSDFRATLDRMGADDAARICCEAAFAPGRPDAITGSHDTWLLRGRDPLCAPYRSRMTLVQGGSGDWQTLRVEIAIRNAVTPIISPDLAEGQRREWQRFVAVLAGGSDAGGF